VKSLCIPRRTFQYFLLANLLLTTLMAGAQVTVTPSTITFSNVPLGQRAGQSAVLANSSNNYVKIGQASVSGAGFGLNIGTLPVTLAPSQTLNFSIAFTPQVSGTVSGSVSFTYTSSSSPGQGHFKRTGYSTTTLAVPLSGSTATLGQLAPSPSSLSFGTLAVGSNLAKTETLTNSGGSNLSVTQASITGAGFSLSGLNLPQSLAPGQSVTVNVVFAPTASGTATGTLSLLSNASDATLSIGLSGSGSSSGQLTLSPTSLNFGSVVVGTSATQSGSLSASGSSVTVSSASSSSTEFAISGISFPMTLAAGQSASYKITFTPQISGAASGTISFASNASTSTQTESLAGSGTAPLQHSVDLSWNASTSAVVGYNVYRGTTAGGPYTKLNSATDASTSYTDNTVQSGQSYYYVTTAVNSSGVESGYSNQVPVSIPTP
jgi:Abnormal spindle-like microcephaly-assoc'd, ASPM-SPD-2-Hydin